MILSDKINQHLKDAMKSRDKVRLQTIRSIRALIIEFEKSGSGKEMNGEEEIKLLSTAAKKRKESIEQFTNAGREDLAVKEEEELKIIMSYLPEQLTEKEIEIKVIEAAKNIGATLKEDFPKLMGEMMKQLKGKAEGKVVRAIVEKVLSEN
ncbi:MAG: GatB/YqeY domain-containing protein [Bacteroidetes bacterium]|nr:GatB/YqeY domain-containing protein [Bacteroidota bacterium]